MYVNHLAIFTEVSKFDSNLTPDMLFSYIMNFETLHLCDANSMIKFVDVPIKIDRLTKLGTMPCNIFRILEVYKNDSAIEYSLTGVTNSMIKIKDSYDEVMISYLGIPIDETGSAVIPRHHIPAISTFVKLMIKEIDHLNGKYDPNLYATFQMQFGNQLGAIRQSAIINDVKKYLNLNVIRYNMIPKVGRELLFKNWM